MPLRPSRFPDSGGIFIFANGVHMEEISRFYRQVKQVKKRDADCTCPYSPYDHVEGRTIMMTWFSLIGCLFSSGKLTRVHLQANKEETRGPMHGCHVSLFVWFIWYAKHCWESAGLNPGPPPTL
jgi:hypothetical protein